MISWLWLFFSYLHAFFSLGLTHKEIRLHFQIIDASTFLGKRRSTFYLSHYNVKKNNDWEGDVEAISAQLSVTILMIWKPVVKASTHLKYSYIDVFNNFISCHIYHIIIYRKLKNILIITSQNNSVSNGKTNVRLNDAVWYSWDIFRDLMKHNSWIRYACYREERYLHSSLLLQGFSDLVMH